MRTCPLSSGKPLVQTRGADPLRLAGRFEFLSHGPDGLHSTGMTTTLPPARSDADGTDPGEKSRARTIGGVGELLSGEEVTRFVREAFSTADLDGKRVCLVVPDGT